MAEVYLGLAGDEARPFGERDLRPHGLRDALLLGHLRHVRRQVTRVPDPYFYPAQTVRESFDLYLPFEAWGAGCVGEGEAGQLLALGLQKLRRRVLEGELGFPAPDLDRPELRVLERLPRDESLTPENLVVPPEHREGGLLRRVPKERDKVLDLDARGPRQRPELDRVGKDAVGGVCPIVEGAGYNLVRGVAKVVVDGDVRVAGELRAPFA